MKFFVLKNPRTEESDAVTDYLPADGSRTGDALRCPICGKFRSMLPLLPPVRVELEAWGPCWSDVAFGSGDQILISGRLKKLFADAGLVGIGRLDPVEIVKVSWRRSRAGDPPDYWLASIQHSRAAIDDLASGLVREEKATCEECRIGGIIKRTDRIVLQDDTWSGEDVFVARGLPGTILVSERFRSLSKDNDLAIDAIIAAEAFSFDHYPQG